MASVTLADAKAHLSALVDQAVRGETVQITRCGKAVAEIAAITDARPYGFDARTAGSRPHLDAACSG